MTLEEFINRLIERHNNPDFDIDAEWWDWGSYDEAHAHGVDEGIQSIIEELKTFNSKER